MRTEAELQEIFEKADNHLCKMFREKTHNVVWTLHGCDRNVKKYNAPVYDDTTMNKFNLHGFYCWLEVDFVKEIYMYDKMVAVPEYEIGASYEGKGILTQKEYDYILKLFGEKYKV